MVFLNMAESSSVGGSEEQDSLLEDGLNVNLDELDDAEFDIPPVDYTPSLESILNDLEDQASLSDDEMSNTLLPAGETAFEGSETLSLGSIGTSKSLTSSERKLNHVGRYNNHSNGPQPPGSILRHVILQRISLHLTGNMGHPNPGLPTAIAVGSVIAVGTSHGLVLVFDSNQTIKLSLSANSQEQGSVSSLTFNHDSSRLLVGYARGNILMYDALNGKLLRTMTEAHPPGTAVLHVKFTDLPTLALCSDSGGSVFELNFRRTMGIRGCDSKCLFSGSRGEVCCLEPLLLNQLHSHPLRGAVLIAMATLSKIIVVSIRPRMRVLFTHPLHSSPATLPLVTWQFVIIQMADSSRVVDPVLAFARESILHFFQVYVDSRNKIRFIPLQKVTLPYLLLSLHWLNTRTLATIDTLEQLHLLDVRTQEELEVLDLSTVGLVYGTSHFKGLSTGGNVSKAMALAGERACYNSIVSYSNQLLILGTKTFHVLSIRAWNDRLNYLVKQNRYLDALSLGMSFYLDKGKAVVGLKGPKEKRKEMAKEKVLEILCNYIDDTFITGDGSTELFQEAIPACIEYCIELEVMDILFTKLWDACTQQLARACYLESLEPWILNDRLPSVSPSVMQEFVQHYEQNGNFQALEACIVHLEVTSLDINQVMKICILHGLYDAIIHIYNKGMHDYLTPFQELMSILQSALSTRKQLADQQITLGNKLLVYISCCLAGRAYPVGDIEDSEVQSVKHEIFKCLTSLHSKDALDSELPYPYLRTLLQFDTREFLNVLALAFEEPEFTSELGLRQVQRLVDILLLIMVQGDGFMPSQVGSLFTFLARQLAKPWCSLHVERQLFEQVVEFLTESSGLNSLGHHEERQQALLELMRAGGLQHYNQDNLLRQADKAGFYRVCELLYEQRQEYDKIVHCYLKDPLRKPQVFSYLRNIFLLYRNSSECSKVETQVVDNICDLLDIDCVKTGQIICLHLVHLIPSIVEDLQDKPKFLFQFLQGLIEYKETQASLGQSKDDLCLEPHIVEKYIDLLCAHAPDKVYEFVSTNEGYRLDNALDIVRKHDLTEATAFLMEKAGDFHGAVDILLEKLESQIKLAISGSSDISDVINLTVKLTALCQRGSKTLDEKGRQEIWFLLLECLMKPQRDKATCIHLPVLKELTQQLLTSMSGFVSLPAMIQFILKDPAYADGKFGDIRELMMGMLSNSCYEETLLQATSRLLSNDLHNQLAKLLASTNKGLTPQSSQCSLCQKSLSAIQDVETVMIFRCGHGYHSGCLEPPWHCCHCPVPGSPDNKSPRQSHSRFKQSSAPPSVPFRSTSQSAILDTHEWRPGDSQGLLQSESFALNLASPPLSRYNADDMF